MFQKLREAALRLPPRAPVVEGQDPHRVPERDLLRRGRHRGRGRRPHLLRLQPPTAADPATMRTPTCASELYPWEAALLAGIISSPSAYSPRSFPEAATARRNLVLQNMVEQGYVSADGVRGLDHRPRLRGADGRRHRPSRGELPGPVLHLVAAPAARRPLRSRPGVRRRPADHVDDRPRPAERGRERRHQQDRRDRADRVGGRARQRHRGGAGDGRRARTSRRRRSTSPPTAIASRDRRSSRSP